MVSLLLAACIHDVGYHERANSRVWLYHSGGPASSQAMRDDLGFDLPCYDAACVQWAYYSYRSHKQKYWYRRARRSKDWEVVFAEIRDPRDVDQPLTADILERWPGLVCELDKHGLPEGIVDWGSLEGHQRIPALFHLKGLPPGTPPGSKNPFAVERETNPLCEGVRRDLEVFQYRPP